MNLLPALRADRYWPLLPVLASIIIVSVCGSARAGLVIKSALGTDLGNSASWGGAVPRASDVAVWTTNSLGAGLTLQAPAYWSGIRVEAPGAEIGISGSGVIDLGAGGVDISASAVNMSLNVSIILSTNQTWTVDAPASLTVAGAISGGSNWIKSGSGTLTLAGNSPLTGMTIVNGGIVVISGQLHWNENWQHLPALTINAGGTVQITSGNAANFLGQSNFEATNNTIAGGTLQFATQAGVAESIYRAFSFSPVGGTIEVLNSNATLIFEYFSDPMQFTVPALASLTLAGNGNGIMNKVISGYGGVVKSGTGTWTLAGANNYAGPTLISNGTLVVSGSLWNGPVTVAAGATLAGSGTVLGNITFLPGAQARFTNGATANWSGTLTLNNNAVHLNLQNQLQPGSYVIATYQAPGSTGNFAASPVIDSGSLPGDCTARIKTDRGAVTLVVVPPPAAHLAILAINGGVSVTAGLGFSVAVQAQDTTGSPLVVTADTPVVLSLNSGYGKLGGTLYSTIPAGSSSAVIDGVTYSLDEGGVVITASSSGALQPGDSSPFTVSLGPPASITLTSNGDWSAGPGTILPDPFLVTVADAGGNPVPGAQVTFSMAAAPPGATGQALSVSNATTAIDGTASSTFTLGSKLGSYTVIAALPEPNTNPAVIIALAANKNWTQIWSDEFNYYGLPDSNKWNYENGFVRNGENQYYTTNRLENACVTNGMLAITARKEAYTPPGQFSPVASYTSASLITLGKESWTYGRLELRAKMPLPYGGVWTAFWTQGTNFPGVGWPMCGELDIVEYVNWNPNPHGNAFWSYNGGAVGDGRIYNTPTPSYNDFHVYAVEWSADRMTYFYDQTNYYTIYTDEAGAGPANPFRRPQYLLLNFALGGAWGGKIYDPGLPQQYLIDYVRVYKRIPTWTGAGSNALWSTAGNWTNSAPPASGDTVAFAGGASPKSVVDGTYTQAAVVFYETTDSEVIGATNGGMLLLTTNGISNFSTNEQTFNVPLVLAADQTFNADSGRLTIGGAISGNGFGLIKTGASTLGLLASNTYSGPTTINAGTLALGPAGSLATSGLNLAAGATFDASACGDFTLAANQWCAIGASGALPGAQAACLQAGSTNFIYLNSNPVRLLIDGSNPSLMVSQGTLSIAGNAFTVDSAKGSPLRPGTYPLIVQASGAIHGTGPFPAAVGTAIGPGQTGFIVVSNNVVNLAVASSSTLFLRLPILQVNRTVQLSFSGVSSSLRYRLQVNDDLASTNWTTLFTNLGGTNGPSVVVDSGATNASQRFYRIVTP